MKRVGNKPVILTGAARRSLLNNLSTIVALRLRKATLFEKQARLIRERTAELRVNKEKLAMELTERKRAEEASFQYISLLKATLESTADGILVVDSAGRIVDFNERFLELWHIPMNVIVAKDDDMTLAYVLDQLKNPDEFIAKVRELYDQPGEESLDVLYFRDGRVFERYSRPQCVGNQVTGRVWSFRDITERQRVEEALRESEELHRLTLSNISDAVFITDDAGSFKYICPNVDNIFGYSFQEVQAMGNILGLLGEDLFSPGEFEALRELNNIEPDITDKSGRVRSLLVNVKQISIKGGTRLYTCRDITERKRAEEALWRERAQLRCLIDSASDLIFIKDRDSVYIRCNRESEKFIGLSESEQIGKSDFYFFDREMAERIRENDRQLIEGGGAFRAEEWVTYPDGRRVLLDTMKVPYYGPDGEVQGLVGICRDITERKQAEEALLQSEKQFRSVMDSLDALMYVADMDTYELLFVNKYGLNVWGDILGKTCWETLQSGQTGPCPFCTNKQLLDQQGKPTGILVWEFQNTVTKRWYKCSDSAIQWPDGRLVRLEVATDITDRKQAEEKIRAALAEKEVMLKEIHHRVKNNMQIISTLLELQFQNIHDDEALWALRVSQDRLKSMALVHEKLYQTMDIAHIDFAGYIESLTSHLCGSYVADPEQISLNIEVGDVALLIDKAIPCGLIINELVSNSLKYAFPGGSKGNIAIRFHADDQGVVTLMVADDGVGLPPGMDFRDSKTMGLQLVNMLTKQLQGEISLLNKGGATFTIRFKR